MRMLTVLPVLVVVIASAFMASAAIAKGDPFSAEISGGGLSSPITIDGPLSGELVFMNDALALPPPEVREPAYTVTLKPFEPDAADAPTTTLTYFPGEGQGPALLSGDWDKDRYFQATPEFQSLLDNAIKGALATDDGASALWYIAPGLALGLIVAGGGLAGCKLLLRRPSSRSS